MFEYSGDKSLVDGRIWFLWLIWTIFGYTLTLEILNFELKFYFLNILLCILLWSVWLYGLIDLVKRIKQTFKKK